MRDDSATRVVTAWALGQGLPARLAVSQIDAFPKRRRQPELGEWHARFSAAMLE